MRYQILVIIAAIQVPLLAVDSTKEPLEPVALFNRCYSHLTQQKPSPSNPLLQAVANGRSPIDACMSLLDKAALTPSGPNEGQMLHADDPEALSVIRTMDTFHRTWFSNNDFLQASNCIDLCLQQAKLFDSTEPALHLTWALLGPSISFSEVVTSDSSFEALRSSGPAINSNLATPFTASTSPGGTVQAIDTELVRSGDLIGIRHLSLNPKKAKITIYGDRVDLVPGPIQVHESVGGGILGTKPYLMLNFGRDYYVKNDGGVLQPRRWAQSIFSDLLCRSIPVIRTSDAKFYVTSNVLPSTPPFRRAEGCMSCHASIDSMASVARNLSIVLIPHAGDQVTNSQQIEQWPVTLPPELGLVDSDPGFSSRPPHGRLLFRSYEGKLIQEAVDGFKGLGEAISQTDDFYICAASRYYQFFTGIKVNLQDPGDPASNPLTSADFNYQNEVISLGLDLKKHQSLRTLVQRILETKTYQAAGQRPY